MNKMSEGPSSSARLTTAIMEMKISEEEQEFAGSRSEDPVSHLMSLLTNINTNLNSSSKIINKFDPKLIHKHPGPEGNEKIVKLVNLGRFLTDKKDETIDFELNDSGVQKCHEKFHNLLVSTYSSGGSLHSQHQDHLKCLTWTQIKKGMAAVVDLGSEGFFRCTVHREITSVNHENQILVKLIDLNVARIVNHDKLYPCLSEFGQFPVKVNQLCLNNLTLYPEAQAFRQQLYELSLAQHGNCEYRASFAKITKRFIAVANLYTLENPPVYLNQLIWASVVDSFEGPKLPEVGGISGEVRVKQFYPDGSCSITLYTRELFRLEDLLDKYSSEHIENQRLYILDRMGSIKLNLADMYLAKCGTDDEFYRARILKIRMKMDKSDKTALLDEYVVQAKGEDDVDKARVSILVHFIDYGSEELISPIDLIPIDNVHAVLSRFKPQALKVQLANIKELDVDRLNLNKNFPPETEYCLEMLSEPIGDESPFPIVELLLVSQSNYPAMKQLSLELIHNGIGVEWDKFRLLTHAGWEVKIDNLEQIPMTPLQWTIPPEELFIVEHGVNLIIRLSDITSPSNFKITRFVHSGEEDPWTQMEKGLEKWATSLQGANLEVHRQVLDGDFFAIPWKQGYARARIAEDISEKLTRFKSTDVRVLLVDYGCYKMMAKSHLKWLDERFCSLPPRCAIGSVNGANNYHNWSFKQIYAFRETIFEDGDASGYSPPYCFQVTDVQVDKFGLTHLTGDLYSVWALSPNSGHTCMTRIADQFMASDVKDRALIEKNRFPVKILLKMG